MKPCHVIGLLLILAALFTGTAFAQVSEGGLPPSFTQSLSLKADVAAVAMPSVDVAALLAQDEIEKTEGMPFRFGFPFDVNYTLENSGTWEDLPDGGRLWRLKIEAPDAYSINLLYSHYDLPEGAKFFLYSSDLKHVLGAFTSANNKPWPEFATAPVKGDICILEYYEPKEVIGQGIINISRVVHGYKNIFSFDVAKEVTDFGNSGSCNNNVNCPEGTPWQDEKRAVAMILTSGGSRICSGSLINNVRQDGTPYFLTANHCLGGETTWIFMFNYESPTCSNINGPTNMTVSGSIKRANYATSDFALLQLAEAPPENYAVYYIGWSNINVASTTSTTIHHPAGDIKKISFDYQAVTSADYLQTSGTTHWRIGNWEDGTTEGGSSGSPLFDQNHRVVGQLHGGYASCTSITADWYGKLSLSWTGGGSASNRLRDWLDPDNTGTTTLDGFDPNATVAIAHTPLENTLDYTNDYEVIANITAPAVLEADSLLLFYQVSSIWYSDLLEATANPDEYHGFIPAQAPGTIIDYYIFAKDIEGRTTITDTYSFKVIDYEMALTPESAQGSAVVGDTVYFPLTVSNGGVYDDEYNFTLGGNDWPTEILDESGTYAISSSGNLSAGQNFNFQVAVEVPASLYNQVEDFTLEAMSINQGTLSRMSNMTAISLGQIGVFPWQEAFPEESLSGVRWVLNDGADIASTGLLNPPSPPYALHLDGGDDTLVSQAIDLSQSSEAILSFFYQRGGAGDKPEVNENLWVDYKDNQGQWVNALVFPGDGPLMTEFTFGSFILPAEGLHESFQIRLRSLGDAPGTDDWYVDDIRLDVAPSISVNPGGFNPILGPEDNQTGQLVIANNGPGSLVYAADLFPAFEKSNLFTELMQADKIQPARITYDETFLEYDEPKGAEDTRTGYVVDKDAGGPDLAGNFWIDSDQPGGPSFSWIDVSGTGTDLISLFDDDNHSGFLEMGFDFPYYGNTYNRICIGSNGIIGFDTTAMHRRQKTVLPNTNYPNGILAWLWDDLDPTDSDNLNGHVYFDTTGGRVVIQFVDYSEYQGDAGDVITAEVILYPDGTIKFQYLAIAPGFDVNSCTVGIESPDGLDGLQVAYVTPYLHDNLAIVFYQPLAWLSLNNKGGTILPGQADTLEVAFNSSGLSAGQYPANIVVTSNDPDPLKNPTTLNVDMTVTDINPYICGDADNDGLVNVLDIVYLIDFKFKTGPPPVSLWAADVNGDIEVNILDILYMIAFKYQGGPAPACL